MFKFQCLVVDRCVCVWEWGWQAATILLESLAVSSVGDSLESLPGKPHQPGLFHFSPGAVSQASFLTLFLFPFSVPQ